MSELRLNLITREWVIVATERARRPDEFRQPARRPKVPPHWYACPFCPGNESQTPSETYRIDGKDGSWRLRAFSNKFSALNPETAPHREHRGLHRALSGTGRHEVLVETPRHDGLLARLNEPDVLAVLTAYRDRFNALYADPQVRHVIVFKNHGESAGTSLIHPHSQIVGTPVVPLQVRDRMKAYVHYFDDTGTCLMCQTIEDELKEGARVLMETAHFVSFIPYAALSPFHIWIFPKAHGACFGHIPDEALQDLARVLRRTLIMLDRGLRNPDYNLVLRSSDPRDGDSEMFHWYLAIVPRVSKAAGFELGTGMYINASLPEESAAFLRSVGRPKS